MRKISLFCVCLFALVVISTLSSLAHGESQEQATLDGVLRITRKFLYKYYIECPGTGQSCALRNSEDLEKIRPGSRIRVKGHLGTFHHSGSTKDNLSPFPSAWVIYMDVEKVTVLHESKSDQLIKPAIPVHLLPRLSLNRYTGDLGNEYVNSIITAQDVERIIVFKNETCAPDEVHLYAIERVLRANPLIQSFYYIDPNTGNRTRSHKSEVDDFFTALLLTKDGQCIGFDVSREKLRIFKRDGDGWVLRDSEGLAHSSLIGGITAKISLDSNNIRFKKDFSVPIIIENNTNKPVQIDTSPDEVIEYPSEKSGGEYRERGSRCAIIVEQKGSGAEVGFFSTTDRKVKAPDKYRNSFTIEPGKSHTLKFAISPWGPTYSAIPSTAMPGPAEIKGELRILIDGEGLNVPLEPVRINFVK